MAIVDSNHDQDTSQMNQLWSLISELSEQLSQNRSLAVSLFGQADVLNTQAVHGQTGFVLRRFNLDKPKDVYESELERMNAAMIEDNHALQQDNKQLNALIKEYEQTLENVMGAFRNRAREVQEKELSLIKDFESRILSLQDEDSTKRLIATTTQSESLARLSRSFRQFMRSIAGEDPDRILSNGTSAPEDFEPWSPSSSIDWALERDCELSRLEQENEELRRMLSVGVQEPRLEINTTQKDIARPPTAISGHDNKTLGAALERTGSAGSHGPSRNVHPVLG